MLLTSWSPMLCPTAYVPSSVAAGMAYNCKCSSGSPGRLNMSSILWVIRKPPPMLTALCRQARVPLIKLCKMLTWVLHTTSSAEASALLGLQWQLDPGLWSTAAGRRQAAPCHPPP